MGEKNLTTRAISVIVPIYNKEYYLEDCITSILNSSFKNFELILVNDGSVDMSDEICRKFLEKDSRIVYVTKENGGVSSARNSGLKIAKGEYITFVDADDFIESTMLEKLIASIQGCDMSLCGHKHQFENSVNKMMTDDWVLKKYHKKILDSTLFNSLFLNPTEKGICTYSVRILYKREIIYNNRLVFNNNLTYGEDLLFVLQYVKHICNIRIIKDKLYIYRINDNSVTQNKIKNYIENKLYIEDWIRHNLVNDDCSNDIYHLYRAISYINISRNFQGTKKFLFDLINCKI